jgi:hypothetical protein
MEATTGFGVASPQVSSTHLSCVAAFTMTQPASLTAVVVRDAMENRQFTERMSCKVNRLCHVSFSKGN